MKTPKIKKEKSGAAGGHKSARMVAVRDTNNHKVRGLWERNGRYYVQFRDRSEDSTGNPTKVPLILRIDGQERPPQNLDEAKKALRAFHADLDAGKINMSKGKMSLRTAVNEYLAEKRAQTRAESEKLRKRVQSGEMDVAWPDGVWNPSYLRCCTRILGGTLEDDKAGEKTATKAAGTTTDDGFVSWLDFLEKTRQVRKLRDVKPADVKAYMSRLKLRGLSNSSQNLHLTIFRHFLKDQVENDRLEEDKLPTRRLKNVDPAPPKKQFLEAWQVDRLEVAARRYAANGDALAQLIRLLALSGMRKTEALSLRWEHVDFAKGNLHVGMDGMSKSGKSRIVPLTIDALRWHLEHMHETRDPFSPWLFPSPERGNDPRHSHWANPYKAWNKVREKASVPDPAFPEDFDEPEERRRRWRRLATTVVHDLRHHFISVCVHAGINYMTIAEIVGHEDGGVLIGEVYGHVNNTVNQDAMKMLNKRPTPTAAAGVAK